MTAPPSPNNFNTSAQADGVDLSWTYDNVWFGFDGDDGAISGFDEGRWLHPDNGIYVYYREKGSSTFTQYSEISIDDTSESITELNSDTTYEFKLRVYTSGEYSETGIIEETTYLNETRLIDSHSSILSSSSTRLIDLLKPVISHGTASTSSNIRIIDLLENVTSSSTPIRAESSTLISLGEVVTSESKSLDSSAIRVIDILENVESDSNLATSDVVRVVDLLEAINSHSNSITSTTSRSNLDLEERKSNPSYSTAGGSVVLRIIDLLEDISSHSVEAETRTYRSQITFENRESDPSFSSISESENIRIVDLLEDVQSHGSTSRSFTHNERVSLEVVDQQILWNEDQSYWYTNWFSESKILGNEDTLAIRSMVVPDAKQPAAIAQVEYDGEGNGKADAISEPVELGRHEQVEELHGIPIDEDGYYRIRITEYSGYNSLYKLDTAIVH